MDDFNSIQKHLLSCIFHPIDMHGGYGRAFHNSINVPEEPTARER